MAGGGDPLDARRLFDGDPAGGCLSVGLPVQQISREIIHRYRAIRNDNCLPMDAYDGNALELELTSLRRWASGC